MGGIDKTRDWDRVIMHVDMDAFFAALEERNVPGLKGKPVIVGGDPRYRSVVSTCSYEARKYGVHSGMSMAKAKKLCPQAIIISGSLNAYIYASSYLQTIFDNYSPIVEPFSVDEAFLDITGCHRIFGTVENLVMQMKREIKDRVGLTCSVGIAPTKLLAKMGSGENKPDGLTILDREDFKKLFYDRPVNHLWGVGESTKNSLNKIGIFTIGQLAAKKDKELEAYFGKNGSWLSVVARGMDTGIVHDEYTIPEDKSMSHETTLAHDLTDIEKIYSTVLWLSDRVARRMRRYGYVGRTITIKVRDSKFNTITRDRSLNCPTDQGKTIFETARKLIPKEFGLRKAVRLLGVKVSHLEKHIMTEQLDILGNVSLNKQHDVNAAVDKIRDRYGDSIVKLAGTRL